MPLSNRFAEALVYAAYLHADQTRKGTQVPYIAHLLGVTSIALEYGASEDEAIAALLHDAAEDQGGAAVLDEIRRRFGDTVADIVAACTDAWTTPKPAWRPRKEAYLARLHTSAGPEHLVSAADKLHNARTILADYRALGESLWSRFNGGRQGTLWYYRALVEALQAHGPRLLVEELDRVVSEIERLASAPPPQPPELAEDDSQG